MKRTVMCLSLLLAFLIVLGAGEPVRRPYEREAGFQPVNRIDTLVLVSLQKKGIEPANLCSDAVFLRRAFLDVTGTLPTPIEVRDFLQDPGPDKRATLIRDLMERESFADYWALKWCDVLRVKAEFPINLWPNAVQCYHRWIRTAIRDNKPYDEFARELLTSSGSNFRVPPVNFYRAMQGHEPSTIARTVALTLMGSRIDTWPESRRAGMEVLFSRIAYKGTAEWKEEIVFLDPAPAGPLEAMLPDGTAVRVPTGQDPRVVFADWLIRDDNTWFTRNIVNRIWAWLMGRGIVHEPDDLRPDNPPVNPELMAYLEQELVKNDYDLRHIYRLILNSRTYQQSSVPRSDHSQAADLFAHYRVRRLDAEVLIDALCRITRDSESYSSMIPEPFTWVPERRPTIKLADGSITSTFLEMFGRPTRDTGMMSERDNKPTAGQEMHLLNSSHIRDKLTGKWWLQNMTRMAGRDLTQMVRLLYATILSRPPTPAEVATTDQYFNTPGVNRNQAVEDLIWALINSKEFLYRH